MNNNPLHVNKMLELRTYYLFQNGTFLHPDTDILTFCSKYFIVFVINELVSAKIFGPTLKCLSRFEKWQNRICKHCLQNSNKDEWVETKTQIIILKEFAN